MAVEAGLGVKRGGDGDGRGGAEVVVVVRGVGGGDHGGVEGEGAVVGGLGGVAALLGLLLLLSWGGGLVDGFGFGLGASDVVRVGVVAGALQGESQQGPAC